MLLYFPSTFGFGYLGGSNTGLNVSPDGITILLDNAGRSSGDAFVHFVDKESAERALDKHREKIGHRWGGTEKNTYSL